MIILFSHIYFITYNFFLKELLMIRIFKYLVFIGYISSLIFLILKLCPDFPLFVHFFEIIELIFKFSVEIINSILYPDPDIKVLDKDSSIDNNITLDDYLADKILKISRLQVFSFLYIFLHLLFIFFFTVIIYCIIFVKRYF